MLAERGILLIILALGVTSILGIIIIAKRLAVIRRADYLYTRITEPADRVLIDLLKESSGVVTEQKLEEAYETKTQTRLGSGELAEKLAELEKVGIVEKRFMNIGDELYVTWRTNLSSRHPRLLKTY